MLTHWKGISQALVKLAPKRKSRQMKAWRQGRMPNTLLRTERLRRGWTQRQLADFAAISLSTVERAEKGEAIRIDCIQRLCECLSKTSEELGLLKIDIRALESNNDMKHQPPSLESEERDGCFSFGALKTTWKTLDGDGRSIYLPQHIRSHYIPFAQELPEELQARRSQIQQDQEQKKTQGLPFFWNGEIYALDRFVIGREPTNEDMTLDVWFRPSDYYTFLATNMSLNEPALREKYLADVNWSEAVPYFSHSFGVSLAVVTSDGYTAFTQRGKSVGARPKVYDTSVIEGLSRPIDRGTTGEAPDVYRCACRGLAEELGLYESIDFSVADITFLGFGVDTRYALRGLTGMVKIKRSIEKLLFLWDNGVRDKFENQQLFPVPFTPKDVVSFAYAHQPFAPGPTLYNALVHEFGRPMVEDAFDSVATM
jgi:transcriptional regulator with XRE-family HTH domain